MYFPLTCQETRVQNIRLDPPFLFSANILLKISSIQCITSKYTFITNVYHPLFFKVLLPIYRHFKWLAEKGTNKTHTPSRRINYTTHGKSADP